MREISCLTSGAPYKGEKPRDLPVRGSFMPGFCLGQNGGPHPARRPRIERLRLRLRAPAAAGVDAIVESQRRVALYYFEDGSVEAACPPLQALLHIMAHGSYQGAGVDDSRLRALFRRETLLETDWYQERLRVKQERDRALWRRHAAALETFRVGSGNLARCGLGLEERDLQDRQDLVRRELERVSSPLYLSELRGSIGADPFHGQMPREALE